MLALWMPLFKHIQRRYIKSHISMFAHILNTSPFLYFNLCKLHLQTIDGYLKYKSNASRYNIEFCRRAEMIFWTTSSQRNLILLLLFFCVSVFHYLSCLQLSRRSIEKPLFSLRLPFTTSHSKSNCYSYVVFCSRLVEKCDIFPQNHQKFVVKNIKQNNNSIAIHLKESRPIYFDENVRNIPNRPKNIYTIKHNHAINIGLGKSFKKHFRKQPQHNSVSSTHYYSDVVLNDENKNEPVNIIAIKNIKKTKKKIYFKREAKRKSEFKNQKTLTSKIIFCRSNIAPRRVNLNAKNYGKTFFKDEVNVDINIENLFKRFKAKITHNRNDKLEKLISTEKPLNNKFIKTNKKKIYMSLRVEMLEKEIPLDPLHKNHKNCLIKKKKINYLRFVLNEVANYINKNETYLCANDKRKNKAEVYAFFYKKCGAKSINDGVKNFTQKVENFSLKREVAFAMKGSYNNKYIEKKSRVNHNMHRSTRKVELMTEIKKKNEPHQNAFKQRDDNVNKIKNILSKVYFSKKHFRPMLRKNVKIKNKYDKILNYFGNNQEKSLKSDMRRQKRSARSQKHPSLRNTAILATNTTSFNHTSHCFIEPITQQTTALNSRHKSPPPHTNNHSLEPYNFSFFSYVQHLSTLQVENLNSFFHTPTKLFLTSSLRTTTKSLRPKSSKQSSIKTHKPVFIIAFSNSTNRNFYHNSLKFSNKIRFFLSQSAKLEILNDHTSDNESRSFSRQLLGKCIYFNASNLNFEEIAFSRDTLKTKFNASNEHFSFFQTFKLFNEFPRTQKSFSKNFKFPTFIRFDKYLSCILSLVPSKRSMLKEYLSLNFSNHTSSIWLSDSNCLRQLFRKLFFDSKKIYKLATKNCLAINEKNTKIKQNSISKKTSSKISTFEKKQKRSLDDQYFFKTSTAIDTESSEKNSSQLLFNSNKRGKKLIRSIKEGKGTVFLRYVINENKPIGLRAVFMYSNQFFFPRVCNETISCNDSRIIQFLSICF